MTTEKEIDLTEQETDSFAGYVGEFADWDNICQEVTIIKRNTIQQGRKQLAEELLQNMPSFSAKEFYNILKDKLQKEVLK